jgi:hypothetical protein
LRGNVNEDGADLSDDPACVPSDASAKYLDNLVHDSHRVFDRLNDLPHMERLAKESIEAV